MHAMPSMAPVRRLVSSLYRHRRGPRVAPPVGMVEEFSRRMVVGWLSVAPDAPPTRVDLVLDDLVVASTVATANPSMSGIDSVLREGPDGPPASPPDERVHSWQRPAVPGPRDDRRNAEAELRVFAFRIRGIWPFVRRTTRIRVRVEDQPLPIHRHGTFLRPPRRGRRSLAELRSLLEQGHVLDQLGRVSLRRDLDSTWQSTVMGLHRRVADILSARFDHDTFLIYGTLLGAVREGAPIVHDPDFDVAYLSRHRSGAAAAEELVEVALALVHEGLDVDCHATALHVHDPADPSERIDIFHCYVDEQGRLAFPWGIAGHSVLTEADWQGLEEIQFLDDTVLVPRAATALVEHLYGPDWREPKPGFNWHLDRTGWAVEGHLTVEQRTRVYWANFYSRHQVEPGSTFSTFVLQLPDLPARVVDLGCGDGRDSFALARAGHQVLALDESVEGVELARARAEQTENGSRMQFSTCDVADRVRLRTFLLDFRDQNAPVAFYLRFFLHAIPEPVQEAMLETLAEVARPGDLFLAEFRTAADEATVKVHGKHYRRYLDAAAFRQELESGLGFTVEQFVEQRGLSPYGEEDPVLCRIVARRTAGLDGPEGG